MDSVIRDFFDNTIKSDFPSYLGSWECIIESPSRKDVRRKTTGGRKSQEVEKGRGWREEGGGKGEGRSGKKEKEVEEGGVGLFVRH